MSIVSPLCHFKDFKKVSGMMKKKSLSVVFISVFIVTFSPISEITDKKRK